MAAINKRPLLSACCHLMQVIILLLRKKELLAKKRARERRFWVRYHLTERKQQSSNCLGAMDGKQIAIECPPNSGSEFYNDKKFFSTVLFSMCDSRYCFTTVNIGANGRGNDTHILYSIIQPLQEKLRTMNWA